MNKGKTIKLPDTSQNSSDNTQFLSFLPEDFIPDDSPIYKEIKSKKLVGNDEFLMHVCSQYKLLLESDNIKFWSTVQYNSFIGRSMDSFLAFARRTYFNKYVPISDEHSIISKNEALINKLNPRLIAYNTELYRIFLQIYCRLATDPRKNCTEVIPFGEILFDNWLFDLPKFLDICGIYGDSSPKEVKEIINSVFEIQKQYEDDFMDFLDECVGFQITEQLKIIHLHRKREDISEEKLKSDTNEKEKALLAMLDLVTNFNYILDFFPRKCSEAIFYDDKCLLTFENAYIIINSDSKTWKVTEEKREFLKIIAKTIKGEIVKFGDKLFKFAFDEILKNDFTDNQKNKKFWTQLNNFFQKTGKTAIKKKDDEGDFKYLRKLLQNTDFSTIISKAPSKFIKDNDVDQIQVLIMVLREKIEEIKLKKIIPEGGHEEAKIEVIEPVQQPEEKKEIPKAENVIKEIPQVQDSEEDKIRKEFIKIVEMTRGKKEKYPDLDDDEIREIARNKTLMLAQAEYDDEYDDTLEAYQDNRFKMEKNDDSDDLDEEENVEGGITEDDKDSGNQKRNYNNPKQNRNYDNRPYENRPYESKGYENRNQDDRGDTSKRDAGYKPRGQKKNYKDRPKDNFNSQAEDQNSKGNAKQYEAKGPNQGNKYYKNNEGDDRDNYNSKSYKGEKSSKGYKGKNYDSGLQYVPKN